MSEGDSEESMGKVLGKVRERGGAEMMSKRRRFNPEEEVEERKAVLEAMYGELPEG